MRTAFVNILLGGTGDTAGEYIHDLFETDGQPYRMVQVSIDTDPATGGAHLAESLVIGLDGDQVASIRGNLATFGPQAKTIVEKFDKLLHEEDIGNGARTTRALTQLAFIYYRNAILQTLRRSVLGLARQGGFDRIVPVLISSSGGGTGSALQVLLPMALRDPVFARQLTEGFPRGFVQTPISFVVEPFAYALRHRIPHADKILANAFALRIEMAFLERQNAYKYVFHLGLANTQGTVLDSPEEIARVLGCSVYQFERNFQHEKSRFVDTVDSNIYAPYTGQNFQRMPVAGAAILNGVHEPDPVI